MKITIDADGMQRTVDEAEPIFAFSKAHTALIDMQNEHADQRQKADEEAAIAEQSAKDAKAAKKVTIKEVTPSAVVDEK